MGACLKGWEGVGRVRDIETQGACLKGRGGLGWGECE